MSKTSLGIKRTCLGCTAAFYDMQKRPIHCPKCQEEYKIEERAHLMEKAAAARKDEPIVEDLEVIDPEFVESADELLDDEDMNHMIVLDQDKP